MIPPLVNKHLSRRFSTCNTLLSLKVPCSFQKVKKKKTIGRGGVQGMVIVIAGIHLAGSTV